MPSKESLERAREWLKHDPQFAYCVEHSAEDEREEMANAVADLLDEAIQGARRTAQEDVAAGFQACYMFDQKLSVAEVCRVIRANVERERLAQLREGKT